MICADCGEDNNILYYLDGSWICWDCVLKAYDIIHADDNYLFDDKFYTLDDLKIRLELPTKNVDNANEMWYNVFRKEVMMDAEKYIKENKRMCNS